MALKPSLYHVIGMKFKEFILFRKGVIIGLLALLVYIIHPFIDVLAYSCAFAYMTLPIYYLLRKKFSKSISAGLAIGMYIVPIMIIGMYALITLMNIVFSFNPQSIEPYITKIFNEISGKNKQSN